MKDASLQKDKILKSNGVQASGVDTVTVRAGHNLTGHEEASIFAVFSPDSSAVATSSLDGTVRLWSVLTGKECLW